MRKETIHILGAGLSGLTAAIQLAKAGYQTVVHDENDDAGKQLIKNFQGIENWSTKQDALYFLKTIGIETNFRWAACQDGNLFGSDLTKRTIRSRKPLFYMIERGTDIWSFDQGLKRHALAEGVSFEWNDSLKALPEGKVIVTADSKVANAGSKVIVFETTHRDCFYVFLKNQIGSSCYSYLLVRSGTATFVTCIFRNLEDEKKYFASSLRNMRKLVNIDIYKPKEVGGVNYFVIDKTPARRKGVIYISENPWYKNYLWGFGVRNTLLSGYLAAQSIIQGQSYSELYKTYLKNSIDTSRVQRWISSYIGSSEYNPVLKHIIPTCQDFLYS